MEPGIFCIFPDVKQSIGKIDWSSTLRLSRYADALGMNDIKREEKSLYRQLTLFDYFYDEFYGYELYRTLYEHSSEVEQFERELSEFLESQTRVWERKPYLLEAGCENGTQAFYTFLHEISHLVLLPRHGSGRAFLNRDYILFEIERLQKRRDELRRLRKIKTERVSNMIRTAWLNRNLAVGRSSTSSVTDTMLLSIPTPPTFKAANRSLMVGGAVIAF